MVRDGYILIADDDIDDRDLITEALKECDCILPLKFFGDGVEIVNHLSSNSHSVPLLMFIDLNMPMMDGVETLRWIRAHDQFRVVPVLMLTTTVRTFELERCTKLGANAFLTKSYSFRELCSIVRSALEQFLPEAL